MVRHTRPAVWKLHLPMAALLLSVAATTGRAMEAPASAADATPVEELVELNEVWVRGKKLARRVADAEDRLFRLYNKLNKNDIYDVHCGSLALQPGSMIMQRTCLPGYLSHINYVSAYPAYPFSEPRVACGTNFSYSSQGCSFGASGSSGHHMSSLAARSAIRVGSSVGRAASEYSSVPPSVLAAYRREAYAQNVLDVITSDPRLVEMATEVIGLYREMELVQNRYGKMRGAAGLDGKEEKRRRPRGKFPRHL